MLAWHIRIRNVPPNCAAVYTEHPDYKKSPDFRVSTLMKQLLKSCSATCQVARKVWMGMWNSARDREPDKKEEQAFKQFLISKYERKQWYKSLAEVKMEESAAAGQASKAEAKLQPPPSSKVSPCSDGL